jgi:hypothetical protein
MNYDRNGVLVTTSQAKPALRKCTRVVTVDSRDRDPTKFVRVAGGPTSSDPGDYTIYLPRVFNNVTSIRMKNAAIQGLSFSDTYIMVGLEGLNRIDECAPGGDRSGFADSAFAKLTWTCFPTVLTATVSSATSAASAITYTTAAAHGLYVGQVVSIAGTLAPSGLNLSGVLVATIPSPTTFTVATTANPGNSTSGASVVTSQPTLYFNDHASDEQITRYNPPIGSLDRLRVTIRRHTSTVPITLGSGENTFTFEIEYIDNVFEDVSAFETRLRC